MCAEDVVEEQKCVAFNFKLKSNPKVWFKLALSFLQYYTKATKSLCMLKALLDLGGLILYIPLITRWSLSPYKNFHASG